LSQEVCTLPFPIFSRLFKFSSAMASGTTVSGGCGVTSGSGQCKGLEDAVTSHIKGKLESVDSDLPSDLQEEAQRCMESAVAQKMNIGDCIQKVQKDVLSKCNERYAGKRYKGFIKFEYESNIVNITINKFGGGNCQFSAGVGAKKMVCPDPFMGRLSDPNMHR